MKHLAGWFAVLGAPFLRRLGSQRACIFVYHRVVAPEVVDTQNDAWNVSPRRFRRQMAFLAQFADIVPLPSLMSKLAEPPNRKPVVCITFDDGYANFRTNALPVLAEYELSATLFVVSGYVGTRSPFPFDRWGQRNWKRAAPESWHPVGWDDLEACAASGLVTIGSHSRLHLDGRKCDHSRLAEEAVGSRNELRQKLGDEHSRFYAYPFGSSRLGHVNTSYLEAVKSAGYDLGLTTNLGLADPWTDPYLVPRVEAHGLDSPAIIRAKILGVLAPYRLTDYLRIAARGN